MIVSKSTAFDIEAIATGATLLIEKPKTWTSFDVVNKLKFMIKRRFSLPKVKIGHTGTLDPLATGLLMICVGKHTKQIEHYTGLDKQYSGAFFLGSTTPCFDLEQAVDHHYPTAHITPETIEQTRLSFLGPQEQTPPIFSAKRVNGHKAYELARKGEQPEMRKNQINIQSFVVTQVEMPLVHFDIKCTKGTYIRSIARDFGSALNSGAYLASLQRDAIGAYQNTDAYTLDEFKILLEN